MPARYDRLDDALTRIQAARQRPEWRNRVLGPDSPLTSASTFRMLRAVEKFEQTGGASVRDVAEILAVEHSTASRVVGSAVASGLLAKSSATHDQRQCALALTDVGRKELAAVTDRRRELIADLVSEWADGDVEVLITLLDRLGDRFERVSAR